MPAWNRNRLTSKLGIDNPIIECLPDVPARFVVRIPRGIGSPRLSAIAADCKDRIVAPCEFCGCMIFVARLES